MSLAKSSLGKLGMKICHKYDTAALVQSDVQWRVLKIQVHIIKICRFIGKANMSN